MPWRKQPEVEAPCLAREAALTVKAAEPFEAEEEGIGGMSASGAQPGVVAALDGRRKPDHSAPVIPKRIGL
jgi:hypothetical protein